MIPLYKPFMPTDLSEMETILHSGALAYGKWGKKFEENLGHFVGNKNISVVNAFNAAMQVSLSVMDINQQDEIILSPMSCLASTLPIATYGAKVVWADIDPKTGTLDPDSVKSKITSKTKAIYHNHHCGYLGYIDEINAIGKEHGIFIVDDAIEAFGSEYKNKKKIGNTDTDITVFSFQTVRLPNTIDGGGLCFKEEDLLNKSKQLRDLGVNRSIFRDSRGEISKECDITLKGYGVTMAEVNSYIGVKQLEEIDELLKIQTNNAMEWKKIIAENYPDCQLVSDINGKPNYWIFGVLVPDKIQFIDEMREKGYYASGVHLPNNNYSVFKDSTELPGAKKFYSEFVALPTGWWYNK